MIPVNSSCKYYDGLSDRCRLETPTRSCMCRKDYGRTSESPVDASTALLTGYLLATPSQPSYEPSYSPSEPSYSPSSDYSSGGGGDFGGGGSSGDW